MQKTDTKGSILIRAVFLSLIISILFISISTKINKKLSNNNTLNESIDLINNENTNINNLKNITLESGEKIIFDNNKYYNFSLNNNNTKKVIFENDEDIEIEISIIDGSPLYYTFFSYSGNTLAGSITNSGIINSQETFTGYLNPSYDFGSLSVKNLGGYSNIDILSDNKFEVNEKKYKIVKTIGNREVEKSNGIIK